MPTAEKLSRAELRTLYTCVEVGVYGCWRPQDLAPRPGNQRKGQAARHCLKIFEEQAFS